MSIPITGLTLRMDHIGKIFVNLEIHGQMVEVTTAIVNENWAGTPERPKEYCVIDDSITDGWIKDLIAKRRYNFIAQDRKG